MYWHKSCRGRCRYSVIGPLTTDNSDAIFALQEPGLVSSWSLDSIRTTLENPHNFAFGIVCRGVLHTPGGEGGGRMQYAPTEDETLIAACLATAVIDELNILHFVTHKDHRRRGFGKFLLSELIKQAKDRGVVSSFLEVRKSNLPAIRLYQSLGYREIDTRKGYYQTPPEDASIMFLCL